MENYQLQILRLIHCIGQPISGRALPSRMGLGYLINQGLVKSSSPGTAQHQSKLSVTPKGLRYLRDNDQAQFGHEPEDPLFQQYAKDYIYRAQRS